MKKISDKIDPMSIDEKTKKYRELMDQMIVEVKEATIEDHDEPFRGWLNKNHIIMEDIEILKKDSNERSKISALLLENQLMEFSIIDLLQKLQLIVNTDPDVITFKGKRTKKELYELTLGELYLELCKYEAKFLEEIKPLIFLLKEKRNRFTHHLFTSIQGIEAVIKEAKEGLTHNIHVLAELYDAHQYINKNTWYGQMYEKKKVKRIKK